MTNNQCMLCPRNCKADRKNGKLGYCGMPDDIYVARAALHMWEEPCISGQNGSGAVFFAGCPLRCKYCQNYDIANGNNYGKKLEIEQLSEIFLQLQKEKAANINLVTPTHYSLQIKKAVQLARNNGLSIPIVYNCSGYEKVETLEKLNGIVDIYLTDFKYLDTSLAKKYSNAPDYDRVAKKALQEMVRQQNKPVFDDASMMKKGVIVRHLLLPGHVKQAKDVLTYVYENYGNSVYISLMNQYTPLKQMAEDPLLKRTVTKREYDRLIDFAIEKGITQCFIQEGNTAKESFIPSFDASGILGRY